MTLMEGVVQGILGQLRPRPVNGSSACLARSAFGHQRPFAEPETEDTQYLIPERTL
jgi:hypothetical protein